MPSKALQVVEEGWMKAWIHFQISLGQVYRDAPSGTGVVISRHKGK
jgi:hypothetical protein